MKFGKSKLIISGLQSQRLALKRVVWITSVNVILFSMSLALLIYFSDQENIVASENGDFKTRASGNWNSIATWSVYNGSAWENARSLPSNSTGLTTISSGHNIILTVNESTGRVVVKPGGELIVNPSKILTVKNNIGTDLTVGGSLKNAGKIVLYDGASAEFLSGGLYQHNHTTKAGVIPTANWLKGSTCEIAGYTTNNSSPEGIAQSFANFTWNCPLQSKDISLNGELESVTGNLTIENTGTGQLRLATSATAINIGNDFILNGGSFCLNKSNNNCSMNIAGNYIQSNGSFIVIDGNKTGTVSIKGDMTHTGGAISHKGNSKSKAVFVFNNVGIQRYTASGNTIKGNIDYLVNNGSILNLGSSVVYGRDFTVSPSAKLMFNSSDCKVSSTVCDNLKVSGKRSFLTAPNYSCKVSEQGSPCTDFSDEENDKPSNSNSELTISNSGRIKEHIIANTNNGTKKR
jgi:hypothetical protein